MTQPDKFFKDMLEDHSMQAPMTAWSRIEKNIDAKSNKKGLWLKIAAAVMLLAVAAITWISISSSEQNQTITQKIEEPVKIDNTPEHNNPAQEVQPTMKNEVPPVNRNNIAQKNTNSSIAKNTKDRKAEEQIPVINQPVNIEPLVVNSETIAFNTTENNSASTSDVVIAENNATSNTIILTVEEVNEKYLKKNLDKATSDEKKSSGIQKLLTLAADIKNTEGGFGELRDKKNEILALNFREEKRGKN